MCFYYQFFHNVLFLEQSNKVFCKDQWEQRVVGENFQTNNQG